MSIYIEQNKKIKNIFANVDGQKKSISSVWVNKNDSPTKVFSFKKKDIPKIVSWSEGTDEEIAKMIEAHYANIINIADYWNIGDERKIQLSEISSNSLEYQPAQIVTFIILDFDHDILKTPINNHNKTAVSIYMKNIFSRTGKLHTNTNISAYVASLRNTWCENNFRKSLPNILNELIKTVVKYTQNSSNPPGTISEYYYNCWLLSITEINPYIDTGEEGNPYAYFDSLDKLSTSVFWTRSSKGGAQNGNFYYAKRSNSVYDMCSLASSNVDYGIMVGFAL